MALIDVARADLETLVYGVKLDLLVFDEWQRKINFELALAGFSSSGATGAERAAQRRQAEQEAAAEQERLDTEKALLALTVDGVVETARLALADARGYLDSSPAWTEGDDAQVALYASIDAWTDSGSLWSQSVTDMSTATADAADEAFVEGSSQWSTAMEALRQIPRFPGCS